MKIESQDVLDAIEWQMREADRQAAWIEDQLQTDEAGTMHCMDLGMRNGLNFGKMYIACIEDAVMRLVKHAKEDEENEG